MTNAAIQAVVTVTLNPTIDRIIEVPGFCVGGHLRGRLRSRLCAGKAVNVSRVLARLGVANTAVGFAGAESLDAFESCAHEAGVQARFIPVAGCTRENITIIDPHAMGGPSETHIRDVGPTVSQAEIGRLSDELAGLANERTVFVFTGSAAPGLSAEHFGALLDVCMERGARVAVDSSGETLRTAADRNLWLLKPNRLELAELLGQPVDTDAAVIEAGRRLSERIAIVLVTLGEQGAYGFAAGQVLHGRCPVEAGRVRSTVGCGDAMLAGFLAGMLAEDGSIASALRQGLAVAAASAMHDQPAAFAPEDAAALADTIKPDTLG